MPPPPTQRRSFFDDLAFARSLTDYPALTIQVIFRHDLGYRVVSPLRLIAVTGLLSVIAILAIPTSPDARPTDLLVFALVSLACGIAQRLRRLWDLDREARQHSYFIGSSPLDFQFLPSFVRRNRRVARFLDPLFVAAIGVMLLPYTRALALWLILSAFCLRAQEDMVFRHQRNRDLDLSDAIIIAERQTQILERFDETPTAPQQQSNTGLPTGIGDDIQSHIIISVKKRRKQKTNKNTIDI